MSLPLLPQTHSTSSMVSSCSPAAAALLLLLLVAPTPAAAAAAAAAACCPYPCCCCGRCHYCCGLCDYPCCCRCCHACMSDVPWGCCTWHTWQPPPPPPPPTAQQHPSMLCRVRREVTHSSPLASERARQPVPGPGALLCHPPTGGGAHPPLCAVAHIAYRLGRQANRCQQYTTQRAQSRLVRFQACMLA